ncbi:MAG: hypothetical protein M0036_00780 [Desulfobacteraceae bacterium]|nr:hypothetical protein [Desulfobacteraceae bacterium]
MSRLYRYATLLAWGMGIMVSPEALVLQGNFTGRKGTFFNTADRRHWGALA